MSHRPPPPPSHRLTEQRNPRTGEIDLASPEQLVALFAAEDATVPEAVARAHAEIARAIALIEAALRSGGRLCYVGAGTSGRLGVLDASECPPTFGTAPGLVIGIIAGGPPALTQSQEGAEDDAGAGAAAMDTHDVGPRDVVVGIAASGVTPYVRAALERAAARRAETVLLCCADPPPSLRETVTVAILVETGPEVVTGSTRMKAGTATKMVLNMLTTGAMIRLGKTYGNLMVDLQAKSEKLRDRGERIVMEVTGVDRNRARRAIAESGGSVRTGIVMVARDLTRVDAEALIAAHGGRLRPILGDPPAMESA